MQGPLLSGHVLPHNDTLQLLTARLPGSCEILVEIDYALNATLSHVICHRKADKKYQSDFQLTAAFTWLATSIQVSLKQRRRPALTARNAS